MRLIFLTPSLIGSIYGGVYHLTNRQVVLMSDIPYNYQGIRLVYNGLEFSSHINSLQRRHLAV